MFVALGIQRAVRMRHIVMCGPSGCTVFFLINLTIFGEKKITEHKMSSLIFSTTSDTLIVRRIDCDIIQGGSNMTGTDLCVNKPHCAAAVRP